MASRLATINFALIGIAAISAVPAAAQTQQPLKIGLQTTLSGQGAVLAASANVGYRLALKELEASGIAGRKLQVVWSDDQGDPTIGVGEAKRLIEAEKIEVLLGPAASAITLAVAPIVNDAKIPEFSISASNQLTPEVSHYQFTTSPNSDIYAVAMVNYVIDTMKAKAPAMLTDSGATSKSAANAMRKNFDERHVQLAAAEEFTPPANDLTPQLLSLRRRNPDVLLVSTTTPADFGHMIRNLTEISWDLKIVGSPTIGLLTGPILQVAGPEAFNNTVAINYRPFTFCPGEDLDKIDGVAFLAKVKAFVPNDFEHIGIISAATAYDSVYLMKAALEGARALDGPTVTDWVEKNASSVHAFTGRLSASKTKHSTADPVDMVMVQHPEIHNAQGLTQRATCP
jgi:branched-chain amino acid transport system substrate-binding protein